MYKFRRHYIEFHPDDGILKYQSNKYFKKTELNKLAFTINFTFFMKFLISNAFYVIKFTLNDTNYHTITAFLKYLDSYYFLLSFFQQTELIPIYQYRLAHIQSFCRWINERKFTIQSRVEMTMKLKAFENIVRKEENAGDQHFLLLPSIIFYPIKERNNHFSKTKFAIHISLMGECNTILSTYTTYRHLG